MKEQQPDFSSDMAVLNAEARENAGPEPTREEILAYLQNKLSPEAENNLQERLSLYPEAASLLLELDQDIRDHGPDDLQEQSWEELRGQLQEEGIFKRTTVRRGVHPLWRWATAALALMSAGLLFLNRPSENILEPRTDGTYRLLQPIGSEGSRRGSENPETGTDAAWQTLILTLGQPGDYSDYRLEIRGQDGLLWTGPATPKADGTFVVLLPGGFLDAESYELHLLGQDEEKEVPLATYRCCAPFNNSPEENENNPHPTIPADSVQRHDISLEAGDWLDVTVVEQGVDLALTLQDANGVLRLFDGPFGKFEHERLTYLATEDVRGAIVVKNSNKKEGRYEIRVEQRPATDNDRRLEAVTQIYLQGETKRRNGDGDYGVDLYRQAATRFSELQERRREALAWVRVSQAEEKMGRQDAELAALQRAEEVAKDFNFIPELGKINFMKGFSLRGSGNYEESAAAYQESAQYFDQTGLHAEAIRSWQSAGYSHRLNGQLLAARDASQKAVDVARASGDPALQGREINALGETHLALGQAEIALGYFHEAVEFRRIAQDRRGLAISLTSQGTAERHLQRYDLARASFEEAIEVYYSPEPGLSPSQTAKYRSKLANPLIGLGLTELNTGHLDAAEKAFQSAIEAARNAGSRERRSLGAAILNLGEVYEKRGDAPEARRLADDALSIFDQLADPQRQGSTYFAIARAERLAGNLKTAERWMRLAIDRIEAIRSAAGYAALQKPYFARKREYYEFLVDLLVELDRQEPGSRWDQRAFEASERSRARSLLETVLSTQLELPQDLDPKLVQREQEIVERLVALERSRVESNAEPTQEERRLALELGEVEERLRRAHLANAELLRPRTLSFAESRALLDQSTLLLEYSLGDDKGHLFVLGRESFEIFEIPGRQHWESLARQTHNVLSQEPTLVNKVQLKEQLDTLSEGLLVPFTSLLGDKRLILVTEGPLQYIPFAALPDPRGDVLIEHNELVSLPSISFLDALRQRDRPSPAYEAITITDPIYDRTDPRLPTGATISQQCEGLDRLRFSANENEIIATLLPNAQQVHVNGFDANREVLRLDAFRQARRIHFSAHGQVNTEAPMLSRLVLSCVDASGQQREGALHARDLYDLQDHGGLAAELVVLSACKTAIGQKIRGEGLIGLTRGFFHAGAPAVAATLWSVDDQGSAELMRLFYRHLLQDDLPPASALREAQRTLRRTEPWTSPYYWAGFVLQGDWQTSVEPNPR